MAWYGKTLKSSIFAVLDNAVTTELKGTYKKINCGTEYLQKTSPEFPYVRFYKSDSREVGRTFGGGINAVDQTYTIDVFSNDKESTCEIIADFIADFLSKNMRIIQTPIPTYSDVTEYRYTLKASWVVGSDNIIKW